MQCYNQFLHDIFDGTEVYASFIREDYDFHSVQIHKTQRSITLKLRSKYAGLQLEKEKKRIGGEGRGLATTKTHDAGAVAEQWQCGVRSASIFYRLLVHHHTLVLLRQAKVEIYNTPLRLACY